MFVGSRVRGRVVNKLKADFITINDAEEHFGLTSRGSYAKTHRDECNKSHSDM